MIASRLIVPIVFVIAGFIVRPAAADPAQDAQAFINDFGNRASTQLSEKNISDAELVRRFRTLFQEGFDIPFIARAAMGRFWLRATDDEKVDYVALFVDYIVEIYAGQFRDYSGGGFSAKSAQVGADGIVTVVSEIAQPDGRVIRLEWFIADVDGKPKIRDIKNEGVSMIATYRDQFANEIVRHDGKIAWFINALREKTASLHTASVGEATPALTSLTSNLKVTVGGIQSGSGTIMMGLYDRSAGFLSAIKRSVEAGLLNDKERLAGVALRATVGSESIGFSKLPPGRYAIIVYHDENDDGRLNESTWGVPTEGYGFSNNAQGFLSAPSFDAAAVTLDGTDKSIAISLIYPTKSATPAPAEKTQ